MAALGLLLVGLGAAVAIVDRVVLPNLVDAQPLKPFTASYLEQLTGNPHGTSNPPRLDVVVYSDHVRYAFFAGQGDYELSFPASRGPKAIHSDCPHNTATSVLTDTNGDVAAWRLHEVSTAKANVSDIPEYWDFYWDEPLNRTRSGIGQWRLPINFASDYSAAFVKKAKDHPSTLGLVYINVYLRDPGSAFAGADQIGSNTSNYVHFSENLADGPAQWVTIRNTWLEFLASSALEVMFLGAGMLLGSVDWGHALSFAKTVPADETAPDPTP